MNLMNVAGLTSNLTQLHRPIRVHLWHQNRDLDDVLLVKHVSGEEALCAGLEYRLLCVSMQADLPLKEFIALPLELQFVTDRGQLRSVCGIVAQASAGQSDGGLADGSGDAENRSPYRASFDRPRREPRPASRVY